MQTVIGLIIFGIIYAILKSRLEYRVDNYPINRINTSKMLSDKVCNNLSASEVKRNMVAGKYDYKEGEFDLYNPDTWK